MLVMKTGLKQFVRKHFLDIKPTPLLSTSDLANAVINSPLYHIIYGGPLNPDKLFYVIQRSPGSGFFSNFAYVLNHLKLADTMGAIPVIDFLNFPTLYNECSPINSFLNSWEYYFEKVSPYCLDEIYSSRNVLITDGKWLESMPMSITSEPDLIQIYKKYIQIRSDIVADCDDFALNNFSGEKVLGVHFRGQEMRTAPGHPLPPTKKQIVKKITALIKDQGFTKIFLATESIEYYNYLNDKFHDMLCSLDSYRSKGNGYLESPRELHRFYLGRDVMAESILLSRTDALLCGGSSVSETATFLALAAGRSGFLNRIHNGMNSSNPILARYLWYIKSILPEALGGFRAC